MSPHLSGKCLRRSRILQFYNRSENFTCTSIHKETKGWPIRPKYKSSSIRDYFLVTLGLSFKMSPRAKPFIRKYWWDSLSPSIQFYIVS